MADLLTRQGARNLTREIDRVASTIEDHRDALGIPADIAADYAKRSDIISDTIETRAAKNFPIDVEAAEVDKTPAADADPEVPKPTDESAGTTDTDPKSDDQNKPEHYDAAGKKADDELLRRLLAEEGMDVPRRRTAAPEWAQPARNETGDSIEPAPFAAGTPHWDANAIADDRGGPYLNEPDEPYMGGHFAQNWFHQLRDKQQAGQIPGVDKFAARMAMTACLSDVTHVAMVGAMSDSDVRDYVRQLTEIDAELAELQQEIARRAGDLQKQADALSAQHKKLLTEFGTKLPETVKAQGKQVIEVRGILIEYTKVASQKPPTVGAMQAGVLEMAEERLGAEVRDAIDDIWDVVKAERTALKKAVARISYRAASTREAGVMEWLASIQEFFNKVWKALTRVFDMGSSAIKGSRDRVTSAFAEYKSTLADVERAEAKTAADESDDEACGKSSKKADHGFGLFDQ